MAENGRPTAYKPEYDELAFKFSLLGATDKKMADFFGVTEQTLNNWKKDHPSFFESLKNGKEKADAEVAKSLYHRALGYSHPEDKIFLDDGEAVIIPTVKHYPPDTAAAFIWLKNRQGKNWRDRHEITGEDGGPIQVQAEHTISPEDRVILQQVAQDFLRKKHGPDGG